MKPPPAFNAYAAGYDRHFTESAIGRAQRKLVWRAFLPLLVKKTNILEVNCGTGEDAIRMARLGHEVLATDLSGEMIQVAETKKAAAPPLPGLQFWQAGFQELPMVVESRRFGLIFSNFGGLNCISPEAHRQLGAAFCDYLQPGGLLFLVFMSRRCWWEQLYFSFKREPAKAFRRRGPGPVTARAGDNEMEVWYYSPGEVAQLYGPWFKQKALHPIGLFIPPSYLEPLFAPHRNLLNVLYKLDIILDVPILADLADHFAIILKKKD